jgi:hypothetical protein
MKTVVPGPVAVVTGYALPGAPPEDAERFALIEGGKWYLASFKEGMTARHWALELTRALALGDGSYKRATVKAQEAEQRERVEQMSPDQRWHSTLWRRP